MAAPAGSSILPALAYPFIRFILFPFPRRSGLLAALLILPLLSVFAPDDARAQTRTLSLAGPADAAEGDSGTTDHHFAVNLSSALTGVEAISYQLCFSGTATRQTTGTDTNTDYDTRFSSDLSNRILITS